MIISIVGARPNFVKLASVDTALAIRSIPHQVIHTGQHFDREMSSDLFADFGIRLPDENLEIGGGSPSLQTARILEKLSPLLERRHPSWVVVYGDVTSTVAAALAARQGGFRLAHVEAGFRSFDRSMPEEINRVLVDHLSDLCLAPHEIAADNLRAERITEDRIAIVGSTPLDVLKKLEPELSLPELPELPRDGLFGICTLHRPGNVDDPGVFQSILDGVTALSSRIPLLFPVHPRTRKKLEGMNLPSTLILLPPLGYRKFLGLARHAKLIVTDSGGLQEEAAYLGVPTLIVRDNTERPYIIASGIARLAGISGERIAAMGADLLRAGIRAPYRDSWTDGHAGERIAELLSRR